MSKSLHVLFGQVLSDRLFYGIYRTTPRSTSATFCAKMGYDGCNWIPIKPYALAIAQKIQLLNSGTSCQKCLWTPHPWRHSSCKWMHGGSPSSQKFPSNPSPILPPKFGLPCRIPPLCYYCNYSWSPIIVFTAHYTNKRDLIWKECETHRSMAVECH